MEHGIFSLIANASIMVKCIMGLLVFMSLVSWTVMIAKFFDLRSAVNKAESGTSRFNSARDLREAVQSLGGDPSSPLYAVAQQGVLEFNRSKEAAVTEDVVVDNVRRSLHQGVSMEITRLGGYMSLLATAANTAPFIGLLGTVWGIMTSFQSIAMMKSASLSTVAPGISEALIATALGLAVAIPATIGYNLFLGKLGTVESSLVNFAGMFLNRVQREVNTQRNAVAQRNSATF